MRLHIQKSCLSIILFSVCLYSCRKHSHDERVKVIQVKFPTEGLPYVQLDVGKYFIYKDSANGKLDSVVVTKSDLINRLVDPGSTSGIFSTPPSYAEDFSLTLTKFDTGVQTLWDNYFAYADGALYNSAPGTLDSSSVLSFSYPACSCDASTAISSLMVEGKVYNDVIRTIADNGLNPSSPDYRRAVTYWAKGVGIIKVIKTTGSDTKTYFLIRHG